MTTATANRVPLLMETPPAGAEAVATTPESSAWLSFAVAMECATTGCATAEPAAPESPDEAEKGAGEAEARTDDGSVPPEMLALLVEPLVFVPPVLPVVDFGTVPDRTIAVITRAEIESAVEQGRLVDERADRTPRVGEAETAPTVSSSRASTVGSINTSLAIGETHLPQPPAADFKIADEVPEDSDAMDARARTISTAAGEVVKRPLRSAIPDAVDVAEAAVPRPNSRDAMPGVTAPLPIEPDAADVLRDAGSAGLPERRALSGAALFAAHRSEKSADSTGIFGAEPGKGATSPGKMELPADHRAVSARVAGDEPVEDSSPAVTPKSFAEQAEILPSSSRGDDRLPPALDERSVPAPELLSEPVQRAPSGTRIDSVERTVEAIAAHAVQIRHQGGDSLSMVVRPDEKTELRIDLRLNDGQVEAQVFLNHGDRESFAGQWSDLQDRLQQHGIRLSPLEDRAASVGFDQSQHFSQRRESPPAREEASMQHGPSTSRSQTSPTQTPARSTLRGILECYA